MTLSDDSVLKTLNKSFVCGRRNIRGQTRYAGNSNTHMPDYSAKTVNNLSGHHNVQMFFMTANGRVIHCLPGYWSTKHFLHEAKLATDLGKLYFNKKMSAASRNEAYLDLHLKHALKHDAELRRHSDLPGFDKMKMAKKEGSDFKREKGFITAGLKTADQVMHERMAARPFVRFEKFDTAKYIDMGLRRYKYDHGIPKGEKASSKKEKKNKRSR